MKPLTNTVEGSFGHGPPRSLTRGDWALVVLVAVATAALGHAAVTQWLAGALGHPSSLGRPLLRVLGDPVYAPFAWVDWARRLEVNGVPSRLAALARSGAQVVWASSLLSGLFVLSRRRRLRVNRADELHGSARFMTHEEVRQTGLLGPEGVVLGAWPDPKRGSLRYLRHDGPEHCLMFAPTRSGKGVGVVLPTLLTWKHSVVCLDIKDENFALTSGRRRAMGQRVRRLNWGADPDTTARFNPLDAVRLGTPHEIADVQLVASMLTDPDGKRAEGASSHWVITGRALLGAAILHILYRERGREAPAALADVARELAAAAEPADMVRGWGAYPYPESAEWFTEEGRAYVLEASAALGAMSAETLARAFECALRAVRDLVRRRPASESDPLRALAFGEQGDLGRVAGFVRGMVDPAEDACVSTVLCAATLHLGYRGGRLGESPELSVLEQELLCQRSHARTLLEWKTLPHDASDRHKTADGIAFIRGRASEQLNREDRERSSVLSTAVAALELFVDPRINANTRSSDFSLESLVTSPPTSLYLGVTPGDLRRLRPLVRLFLAQLFTRLTEQLPEAGSRERLLLLLDELPAFGAIPAIEDALPYCAGYGLKAYVILQDIGQLYRTYGRQSTILSNCHARLAYAPNLPETAEFLSRLTGRTTVVKDVRGASVRPMGLAPSTFNESQQEVGRPLLTADECLTLPRERLESGTSGRPRVLEPGHMLIFLAGHRPILARKVQHYDDPSLLAATEIVPAPPHERSTTSDEKGRALPLPAFPAGRPESAAPHATSPRSVAEEFGDEYLPLTDEAVLDDFADAQ